MLKRWLMAALCWLSLTAVAAGAGIDINAATALELETLPGIGPKKAQAIIEYRKKNGPFESIDELQNVKGLGKSSVEKMRPDITWVDPAIHGGKIE